MDFSFSEEQETVGKVARELFEHHATPERLTEVEAGGLRHDGSLWSDLADADLLGVGLPESVGGSGGGFLEVATLLTEAGRSVAPVPVHATLVLGADTIARHGDEDQRRRHLPSVVAGQTVLTAALSEPGNSDPTAPRTTAQRDGDVWRLEGPKELVPAAQLAATLVVSARDENGPGLFLVESTAPGVRLEAVDTTNGEPYADVDLVGAPAQRLGDGDGAEAVRSLYSRALVGLCALQLGVTERALSLAAAYTAQREQFGRPIGSFQAVQQRMADAFIDVEAIRWTTWHAAWLIAQGRPADRDAAIAKFWAAEAGARVVATAQQVHGGMGIDVTYPLSRYFLWAKQIELSLGSATQQLVRLGGTYSEGVR
ncbi:acyl-CoA dehydrogenase family protein [Mycobacterium sp. ACS4331]|uniref:acyl-CoA dehydrogenase family protein n=1 Tax=Mycobacterium sp. ACS4331 TaxID=1834121 RepID=UPI000802112B|nr:acyl-CoA dehydrogenase family protein [Mycobacterium sp. ACS4331]OBF20391.1 acyl-CoA dehydrogenase [Mycobacterium sp. ACS4331]